MTAQKEGLTGRILREDSMNGVIFGEELVVVWFCGLPTRWNGLLCR